MTSSVDGSQDQDRVPMTSFLATINRVMTSWTLDPDLEVQHDLNRPDRL